MEKPRMIICTTGCAAEDFKSLEGFTLDNVCDEVATCEVTDEETDVLVFHFKNNHGVRIDMEYSDGELSISEPYVAFEDALAIVDAASK